MNRILKKPYIENKDYDGRNEEIVADEQWTNFLKRNQSIVVDNMYGQYRSTLDCLVCHYRSIQFDPFLMCSLPIPPEESFVKFSFDFHISVVKEEKLSFTFRSKEK